METKMNRHRTALLALSLYLGAASFGLADVHYVDVNSAAPANPYTTWETAARTIQDAVDAAVAGDEVLVTNGVYETGGRVAGGTLTNRVAITKPIAVRSVNGPAVTIIKGHQVPGTINGDSAVRCVYLDRGSSLYGFTLTGGAGDDGGGVLISAYAESLISDCVLIGNAAGYGGAASGGGTFTNCLFAGNWAVTQGGACTWPLLLVNCVITNNSAGDGGGVFGGSLYNCLLAYNWATNDGGGAYAASLYNCTVVNNSATNSGGGGYGYDSFHIHANCVVYNSIIVSNSAALKPDCACTQYDSCIPTPGSASFGQAGNITAAPQFVNAAAGDFRLASTSPCINAANNYWLQTGPPWAPVYTNRFDLDGQPRVVGGAVDMGAYEVQHPASAISFAWLLYYGFPIDGSADSADPDHDGMNNFQEWTAVTDPTNAASALRLHPLKREGTNAVLSWQSVYGKRYVLERTTNLLSPFSAISVQLETNGWGSGSWKTSYVDTNAPMNSPAFYRLLVGAEFIPYHP